MKKYFLIWAMAYLLGFSATGQDYHPLVTTGKLWSVYHDYCKSGWYVFSDYEKFEGDTTINGILYKKVLTTRDSLTSGWTCQDYMREDSLKKVYYRFGGQPTEELIYDFGAHVGDTLHLGYGSQYSYYLLDSIGWVILLDNEPRREFYLHNYNCLEQWIEGIGCLKGLMAAGMCGATGDNPHLMCFFEHDTMKYHNPDDELCYVITGIQENKTQNYIRLFPNPASDLITIQVNGTSGLPFTIKLYDLLGRKVFETSFNTQESTLDLSSISYSKMLLFDLTGPSGFILTGKIFHK